MLSALFVISIYNYHREAEPVVHYFASKGWKITVLIGWEGKEADSAVAGYVSLGCQVLRTPAEHSYQEAATLRKVNGVGGASEAAESILGVMSLKSLRTVLKSALSKHPQLLRLAGLPSEVRRMRAARKFARDLLHRLRPDVVFQGPFHSVGKVDNGFYKEAGHFRILRCCYPVSAYHGRENVIRARIGNIQAGMVPKTLWRNFDILNVVLGTFFRGWSYEVDGQAFFMSDPIVLLAAKIAGLELDDIWQKPQPGFERVFVFSEFSAGLLDDGSFPMKRVSRCGIPLLDEVVKSLNDDGHRKQIYSDLSLEEESPFLLFNVEPSLEHHYATAENHWKNFHDMMSCVQGVGLPVVLSLHPLCNEEDYIFAEQEYGVRISRNWKIHHLYPLSSVVVSFPCSTNVMAEIFSKSLIIYDFMGMTKPASGREREFRLANAKIGLTAAEVRNHLLELVDKFHISQKVRVTPPRQSACECMYRDVVALLKEAQ